MADTARIINIQRMSVHDGEGLRTTVFLKGCPLRCSWCHNPESQSFENEMLYRTDKCVLCGACVNACPNGCHEIRENTHIFHRENCTACLACADACPAGALTPAAKEYTADQVLQILLRDKLFYGQKGGMTVSGGEPMSQIGFTEELCRKAKQAGLNVNIETSGYCPTAYFDRILPYVDVFLYDIKATPAMHQVLTGGQSDLILKNLAYLRQKGANVVLRCPIIPGCNDTDTHYAFIAELAQKHDIGQVDIEPYHAFGLGKYAQLGRQPLYTNEKDLSQEAAEAAFAPYRK